MLKSAIFMATRALEILTTLVIVGFMGYFVHPYVQAKSTVPASLLCLFIVSILAAAWSIITVFSRHRYRATTLLTAIIDLCFVGAFIASVVLLRSIAHANCISASVPVSISVGSHTAGSNSWHLSASKDCALLKAAWALGIANCVFFAITAWAAWSLYQEYKRAAVVVHHKEHRRSGSSDYTRRSSSGHRHHHHHSHSRSNRTYV